MHSQARPACKRRPRAILLVSSAGVVYSVGQVHRVIGARAKAAQPRRRPASRVHTRSCRAGSHIPHLPSQQFDTPKERPSPVSKAAPHAQPTTLPTAQCAAQLHVSSFLQAPPHWTVRFSPSKIENTSRCRQKTEKICAIENAR